MRTPWQVRLARIVVSTSLVGASLALAEAPAPLPPPAAAPSAPEAPSAPVATIAVEDALARALEQNPALRATILDSVAAHASARAASSTRQPTFVASTTESYTERIAGTAGGAVRTRDRSLAGAVGLRYTTDVGTVLTLDVTHTTLWREVNTTPGSTALSVIGPMQTTQMTIGARQPLIRGAGTDAVLGNQRQADGRAESAALDAQQAASQLVVDVLTAYWELWYAERSVDVQHAAVTLAERQFADTEHRQALGTIASADVLRFATERAARIEAATLAEVSVRTRALELARLLAIGPDRARALATREAAPEVPTLPSYAGVAEGLAQRSPALAALAADVDAARALQAASVDASHARLDLVGTTGLGGLWMPNDRYSGLQLPSGRPAVVATVGLELELPLVSSVAQAQRASANATLDAAELRYAAEVARAQATLASQHAQLEGTIARIALSQQTADLATRAAEAERGRNALGTSTPTALLEAQQNERTTRLDALRARVDAELASAGVAHAGGRLLERFALTLPTGDER